MKVVELRGDALRAEAAKLPLADSFFASVGFAELWKTKGGEPVYWAVEDAGAWVAVLPAVSFGRGPLRRLQSMPDGCYGGFLVDAAYEADRPRFTEAILDAVFRRSWLRIHVADFLDRAKTLPRFRAEELVTRLVDIRAPNWRPDDKKLQSQFRAAERQGLVIEDFAWDRHADEYMRLVSITARRHAAQPDHPRAFYEALWELSQRDDRIHWIWGADADGRAAASHIYFKERHLLQGWQIQSDKDMSPLKANQAMRLRTCHAMAARGCTHLNLGATPEGADSLLYYKKRWGGDAYAYRCHRFEAPLARWLGKR